MTTNDTTEESRIAQLRKYGRKAFDITKSTLSIIKMAFFAYVALMQSILISTVFNVADTARAIRNGNITATMFNAAMTLASTLYIWYRAKEAVTMVRTLGRAAITLRNAKFVSAAVAAKTLAPALIAAALIYATYRVAKKLYSEYKFYRVFYDEIDDTTFTQQNNEETIDV